MGCLAAAGANYYTVSGSSHEPTINGIYDEVIGILIKGYPFYKKLTGTDTRLLYWTRSLLPGELDIGQWLISDHSKFLSSPGKLKGVLAIDENAAPSLPISFPMSNATSFGPPQTSGWLINIGSKWVVESSITVARGTLVPVTMPYRGLLGRPFKGPFSISEPVRLP